MITLRIGASLLSWKAHSLCFHPTLRSTISTSPSLSLSASLLTGSPNSAIRNRPVAKDTYTRVQNFLAGLAQRGITVTEWGSLLHCRYHVPLIHVDLDFLVDDNLLEAACRFAEELGSCPAESTPILVNLRGEYETIAHPLLCSGLQRVNLYPASFAGFWANELYWAPFSLSDACQTPVSVLVPRVAPLVACLVRHFAQFHFTDRMSLLLKADLSELIAYTLFDMEYDGDYMTFDQSQDEIEKSTEPALVLFREWDGWRDDEIWIADAVEWLINGKGSYHSLPAIDDPTDSLLWEALFAKF